MSGYIPKTDLESLIIKNPNKEFLDYSLLSLNPQITWEFKLTFLNLDWNWKYIFTYSNISLLIFEKFIYPNVMNNDICLWLSDNRSLDLKIIEKYSDLSWDWEKILYNPKININFFLKFFNKNWHTYDLYNKLKKYNSNEYFIDDNIIKKNPNLEWNWKLLSHGNVSIDTIATLKDKDWCWSTITIHQNNLDVFDKYNDLPWKWEYIDVEILTWDFVKKYHMKNFNFEILTQNQLITEEFILDHPDKPYNWYLFGPNELRSIEVIRKFKDKNLNWRNLSASIAYTFDDILSNSDLPWDWKGISSNPQIPIKFVISHPELNWDYELLSSNYGSFDNHGSNNQYISYSEDNMLNAEKNLIIFKEELIQKTWHPSRVLNWCMSLDELDD